MEEALDRIGIPAECCAGRYWPARTWMGSKAKDIERAFPKLILLVHTVYDGDERIFDALCARSERVC